MKKFIYIITILIIVSSCKSIDKMVESGNYDQAIRFAVDKLQGQENKKTKYVKGLEKAYSKLVLQDLSKIKHLELNGKNNRFDRIVETYENMEDRQNYINPLLPLVSKDGYLAEFKLIDYTKLINTAKLDATEFHYIQGQNLLSRAVENNNKLDARRAFEAFQATTIYYDDYKNTQQLKQTSYEYGQSRILIETYSSGSNIAFEHTIDIINQIDINQLNNTWEKFYTNDNTSLNLDYIATIEVSEITPGKERERYYDYTETKEIKDGTVPIKDTNGNEVKDTSGNIIYTDKIIITTAHIREIVREKIAYMTGKIVIISVDTNNPISNIPIHITHRFEDYSCEYTGDKRALSSKTEKRLKPNCNPFPTDYEITKEMAHQYQHIATQALRKQIFEN